MKCTQTNFQFAMDEHAWKLDEFVLSIIFSKCFIRCYLEKQEILKNDILDRERGMELDLARNEDILDDCSKEARGEKKEIKRCIYLSLKYFCLFHCHWI